MSNKRIRADSNRARAKKATFVGVDLAWSNRNPSGCAVIRNNRLVAYSANLVSLHEIVGFIQKHLQNECPAVIGVDAPLRVPNESGSRICDRELSAEWRVFQAGALPANRQLFSRTNPSSLNSEDSLLPLSSPTSSDEQSDTQLLRESATNPVRGEVLVALLAERLRFSESALIPRQTGDRMICEIYPHPAHVSLFELDKTLKYKARSKRTLCERYAEFRRYQLYLRTLRHADLPLKRTKKLLTKTAVEELKGKALKRYEDTLDAITCAYSANYLWFYGPSHARTYGTLSGGHIIVPLTNSMLRRLA